ncbi:MAG: MFS transporter [Chloroflexi bacterium]|nr:MFS transporter [Chloroflexota bacterium]
MAANIITPLPVALVLRFVYGLKTSAGIVVFNSVVQEAVPDSVRGRVFTLLDVTWHATRLLSLALGGLLVDRVGIQPLYWSGGLGLLTSGVLGVLLLGRELLTSTRRMDR